MRSISEYIENNLPHTKEGILSLLKNSGREILKEMRENPSHSLSYYNGLTSLFTKIYFELESRRIFDAPENWFYSFSITNKKATLYLKHIAELREEEEGNVFLDIDETFRLINYPVKQYSVEEYAAATNTETVTIRQWIRRGKLRNALKIGGEWRIPEITDPPRRGYTPVSYYNRGGLITFPKEFGVSLCMQPNVIDIYQSPEGKGYVVLIDKAPAFFPNRLLSEAEREKLELLLISNPNITNSASIVGTWPKYNEVEKYRAITRCGDMRLPNDWDEDLF